MDMGPPPGVPGAPPTRPFHAPPPAPAATWPTAIGVILIVYSGLFSFCGIFGQIAAQTQLASQPAAEPVTGFWAMYHSASIVLGYVLLLLLIPIGIGVLLRRRWSVRAAQGWSAINIAVVLIGLIISAFHRDEILKVMQQAGAGLPPQVARTALLGGVCVGMGFSLIVPCFLLIWFWRPAVREEVRQWR